MLAAILTFCGTMTTLTSCSSNDEPVEEVLIPGCGVTDTNQLKDPALSSVTDDLNVTLHISR